MRFFRNKNYNDYIKARVFSKKHAIPNGLRVYAIGDIHGRCDLLDEIHGYIKADIDGSEPVEKNIIIYLGDYIDRGGDSRGVIESIITFSPIINGGELEKIYLKGNHEDALINFLDNHEDAQPWLSYGGVNTLISYGMSSSMFQDQQLLHEKFMAVLPQDHLDFFTNQLRLCHTVGDFMFVHAGINPDNSLSEQTAADLMWIRHKFLNHRAMHAKIIVHGHSISKQVDFQKNRIGVDTGAYATSILSCLVLEGVRARVINTRSS